MMFRDKKAMHAFWRERSRGIGFIRGQRADYTSDWEGQATWWRAFSLKRGRWRRRNDCGMIMLHRKRIGVGIVSHEMTHAASFFMVWDLGLDPHPRNRRAHEKFCCIQGSLVAQFWVEFYKHHPRGGRG